MNVSFPIPQPNSQEQKRLVPEIKTFSARQLKEDLDHLILTLNELHPASPNTGIFYPQWEFEDLHRHLDNPMTRIDFCRLVAPRIARLRDGHTWLGWEEIPELKSFDRQPAEHFPIRVKLKRSGIYIDEDCPEDPQVRKENKITKINGIGSSTIATRIRSYSNFEFESVRNLHVADHFKRLLWLEFGLRHPFEVEIQAGSKKRIIRCKVRRCQVRPRSKAENPLSFRMLEENRTGLLEVFYFPVDENGEFKKKVDQIFLEMKQKSVSTLIIDVRRCAGGDDKSGDYLLSYIAKKPFSQFKSVDIKVSDLGKQRRKNHFTVDNILNSFFLQMYLALPSGTLINIETESTDLIPPLPADRRFKGQAVVVAGQKTYSAGSSFVSAVKAYGLAPVVGVETGQPSICFGGTFQGILPHTHIRFGVSTKKFTFADGRVPNRGVIPDCEVDPETALEYIFEHLQATGRIPTVQKDLPSSSGLPENDSIHIGKATDRPDFGYPVREGAIEKLCRMDHQELSELLDSADELIPAAKAGYSYVLGARLDGSLESQAFLLNRADDEEPIVRMCTVCAIYKLSFHMPFAIQRLQASLSKEQHVEIRWILKKLLRG